MPFSPFSLLMPSPFAPKSPPPSSSPKNTPLMNNQAIKSDDINKNVIHFSNKRKEFESRSEKRDEHQRQKEGRFECPICGVRTLNGSSDLRDHFENELNIFLESCKHSRVLENRVKRPREEDDEVELEEIDVESMTTDALVTSSSCSPVSSHSSIQSLYNPRFPSEYNRSKGERWEVSNDSYMLREKFIHCSSHGTNCSNDSLSDSLVESILRMFFTPNCSLVITPKARDNCLTIIRT